MPMSLTTFTVVGLVLFSAIMYYLCSLVKTSHMTFNIQSENFISQHIMTLTPLIRCFNWVASLRHISDNRGTLKNLLHMYQPYWSFPSNMPTAVMRYFIIIEGMARAHILAVKTKHRLKYFMGCEFAFYAVTNRP